MPLAFETELPLVPPHTTTPSGPSDDGLGESSRRRLTAVGTFLLVVAVALIIAGTILLHHDVMWLRVTLVFGGIAVAYRGLHSVLHAIFQRRVDVLFAIALTWVIAIGAAVLLAPILPLGEYVNTAKTLQVPSFLRPALFSSHPLGTNRFGLDMLARVIWGGRESLTAATLAVTIGTVVGGFIGIVAGYFGGIWDRVIGVVTNVGLAFPPLVLLLVVASVLEGGLVMVAIALSLLVIPATIRIARANAIASAQRDFTFAARILGATRWQVLIREILPNVAPPLIALGFLALPLLIVTEASLSFLGLGVQAPSPSWGNMLAEGTNGVFEQNPHIVLVPGAALFLTVFSLNLISQRVSKRWDPRQSKL